jgi:hypothetical protein
LLHDDIYEALSDFERQFGNVHVLVGGKSYQQVAQSEGLRNIG